MVQFLSSIMLASSSSYPSATSKIFNANFVSYHFAHSHVVVLNI